VPTPAINPTTGLPEVLPISEFPLFVLTPNLQPSDATQVEVFNLTPYFQQQGEPDKKEIDENLKQIQEIILFTLDGMAVSEREGRPNFRFHPGANLLVVIGGPQSLEITRKVIGALQSQAGGDLAPLRAFGMPGGGVVGFRGGFFGSDAANPFGGGMSKNRRLILSKLESIHIESVQFDSFPLSEVVRILGEESKKRDPDKRGVNFLLQTSQPTGPSPVTGSPTAANPPMEATDLNTVAIRIPQPLNNVRMLDVLDAIVRTADHPIKYSITDYAVVFSLKELDDSAAMPPPSYGSPMGGTPPGGNTAGVPGIR
jgi:hypothetical protein